MTCSIIDFRCILVNELVGNTLLALVLIGIIYFIVAAKIRFGFEATIGLFIPFILLVAMIITGFSLIYAFLAVIVGALAGWAIYQFLEGR